MATFGGHRIPRTVGLMLLVGPTGGWLVFASLVVQSQLFGWGMV
ncbi:hypothetical protein [Mycobacterium sp. Root135]|nr:hypothetical protein [Mycobacterium sp. Root135]